MGAARIVVHPGVPHFWLIPPVAGIRAMVVHEPSYPPAAGRVNVAYVLFSEKSAVGCENEAAVTRIAAVLSPPRLLEAWILKQVFSFLPPSAVVHDEPSPPFAFGFGPRLGGLKPSSAAAGTSHI